ncbi:iron-sulfur cluster carrier protein [Tersicoccus solisilvae]|uniref:Iron-sulfur cluster carrier protein n=1 Tax=Tersicoccus solisilvae TaxID=1882339 RepID=A0ABQ1PPH4_9MICC|nr:Mrp/NBP35 family ATP-binding protein [Tersicoccus solisilvae]GGD00612.1 iron-sulfur cluster carrier protein [Tersicoccus solisilvae]
MSTGRDDVLRQARTALARVHDPELRRPITDLGMLEGLDLQDGRLTVRVLLTIAGCPLRSTIEADVRHAVAGVPGVHAVDVVTGVMSPDQRQRLKDDLRSGGRANPFDAASLTRIYAVASGKGGVGKSSVTVNLAAALAAAGLRVGIIDADVHGFSVPSLMGVHRSPTRVDEMILPPVAHDVKLISIGMFVEGNQAVAWRGPMLHRALEQFLTDVYFGDLDVLLLDLPPGTGDMAISVAQLLPTAQLLLVTTPQSAAADVAERAGLLARQTGQTVAGVIENMGPMTLPDGTVLDLFGAGGGAQLAERLSTTPGEKAGNGTGNGTAVPLLGTVPLDPALRRAGDTGTPVVLAEPDSPAAGELRRIADDLRGRGRHLPGRPLPLSVR